MQKNMSLFIKRRTQLHEEVKKAYPGKKGTIVLFAGFEMERYAFRQESSFYYLTGLEEPAVVLTMDDMSTVVYVPRYSTSRAQWVTSMVDSDDNQLSSWGIQERRYLGNPCKGYSLSPSCMPTEYEHLIAALEQKVKQGEVIFTIYPPDRIIEQTLILDRLLREKPHLRKALVDISFLVARMRRSKSETEIERIYEAIEVTRFAHEAAAATIEPGKSEYQIQASVEFMFRQSGASPAFPSIVGSGKNSTVLHYTRNDAELKKGDLVIVDVGAELDYYCADITRTYPVSGTFTDRQREIYDAVLATQEFIENVVEPGFWFNNKEQPEKSLQHIAFAFLCEMGYEEYYMHSIGHFLGLDVHDVGDASEPFKAGDIITIEPGLYIPEERFGVRIEDNYWITAEGAGRLSEDLPRDSYEIEQMMLEELD